MSAIPAVNPRYAAWLSTIAKGETPKNYEYQAFIGRMSRAFIKATRLRPIQDQDRFTQFIEERVQPAFSICGAEFSIDQMLSENRDDDDFCQWAANATVGATYCNGGESVTRIR